MNKINMCSTLFINNVVVSTKAPHAYIKSYLPNTVISEHDPRMIHIMGKVCMNDDSMQEPSSMVYTCVLSFGKNHAHLQSTSKTHW